MRRPVVCALFALSLAACSDAPAPAEPEEFTIPVYDAAETHGQINFRGVLSGANENPSNGSTARGLASIGQRGDSLYFRLTATGIFNITQAHIHLGSPVQNGGIVVWLYPDAPPATLIPGRYKGLLNEGYANESEFVGSMAGQSIDSMMVHIRSGNAYVNVHTSAFPGGELRDQLE